MQIDFFFPIAVYSFYPPTTMSSSNENEEAQMREELATCTTLHEIDQWLTIWRGSQVMSHGILLTEEVDMMAEAMKDDPAEVERRDAERHEREEWMDEMIDLWTNGSWR